MNLEFITTIVIAVLGLQIILLISLLLWRKHHNTAYKFLALVLSFFLLSLLNVVLFNFLSFSAQWEWIPFLQLELLFGFGPALYCYSKSLSDQSYDLKRIEWLHFLPVVLEFIYYRTTLFRQGAISLSDEAISEPNLLFMLVQWGGLLSMLIYVFLSINLLVKYRKWVSNRYSNLEKRELSWLEKPLIIYSIFLVLWITIRTTDILIFKDAIRPYYFNLGFISLAVITCWIGFKGYLSAQIDSAGFIASLNKQPAREVDQSQLSKVAQALQNIMEAEKLYLDSDLTLAKFASQTDHSPKEISKALNHCLQLNFHEFVNKYRVEAFQKNLGMEKFAHLSLLGIALESGFGSKSTFNLVFKANTGLTPRQYKQSIQQKKS